MSALLFALLAQAQEARYDVLAGGKKAGVATYSLAPRPGGGRVTRLRLVLVGGETTEEVSETDANGAPVRASTQLLRGKNRSAEVVTYTPQGAATVTRDHALPFTVPAPKASRRDPSEAWFRPTPPKPGTTARFVALNPRKRTWEEVKVKYVGKTPEGHLVRQSRNMGASTAFVLDDRGMPRSIESGGMRMVRR